MRASIESTISECSYWISRPSRRPRVSPYARKENRLTPRDSASLGSGFAGGRMALTRSGGAVGRGEAGGCCAVPVGMLARTTNTNDESATILRMDAPWSDERVAYIGAIPSPESQTRIPSDLPCHTPDLE